MNRLGMTTGSVGATTSAGMAMASTATSNMMGMASSQMPTSSSSSMMDMASAMSSAMNTASSMGSMGATRTASSMGAMSTGGDSMNMSTGSTIGGSYNNMVMPAIPTSPIWTPRISPETYVAVQFLLMAVATVTALARTTFRIKKFRQVTLDDALLILAVCFLIVGVTVNYQATSMTYWTTYVNLDLVTPPPGWANMLSGYSVIDNVSNIFGWGTICTVKISFLMFLRGLITRVRPIAVWWWIVFAFTAMSTPVTMFLGFYVCPNFTGGPTKDCRGSFIVRQFTFLCVNCVLDILSDALILTIPFWLIWQVQISNWRKLALGTVLCLSVVMICIALIRVTMYGASLANGITGPDTTWLYFWTNIEGAVAIIMVSLTAFRSMLGQEGVGKGEMSSGTYKSDRRASNRNSRDWRTSSAPSAWQRWSNGSASQTTRSSTTNSSGQIRHIAQQWVDPRLTSIRKEITIRTDYEPLHPPASIFWPSVDTRHYSSEHSPARRALSDSSDEYMHRSGKIV